MQPRLAPRVAAATVALLASGAATGCNSILGIQELQDESQDSGADGARDATVADGDADAGADVAYDATAGDGANDGASLFESGVDAAPDGPITDLNWAQWPMPNAPIQAGDPNPENYSVGLGTLVGTVSDGVTQLQWQVTPMDDAGVPFPAVTQVQAVAYCQGLDFASYHDWRLPTLVELESIVNYGESPTIDSAYFPNTPDLSGGFWSSTADLASGNVWDIFFYGGNVSTNSPTLIANYFRCVRSDVPPPYGLQPDPPGRYAVSDGTVYDNKTLLTWQQTPASGMGWSAASAYCAGWSPDAGQDGGTRWRLPTISELLTLVDYSSTDLIDLTVFPATASDPFWSSTPVLGTSNQWYLLDGYTYDDGAKTTNYVRCVH